MKNWVNICSRETVELYDWAVTIDMNLKIEARAKEDLNGKERTVERLK